MKILPFKIFSTFEEKEVVKIKNYEIIKKIEVIDIASKTLNRYKKLTNLEIARKVMFIFLFNPVVLTLKIFFNVLQICFDCFSYFFSYFTMAKALANKNIFKIFEISITSRIDILKHIAQDIIYIIRAPFFAIFIQFATLITLISPMRARKIIAKIERSWNYDLPLCYDYRNKKDFKEKPLFRALFNTLLHRKEDVVFYLAPCFQPLGSLNDRYIIYPLKEDLVR